MSAIVPAITPLRPVYQTIHGGYGLAGWENCKEASIATLLNLRLRDVPPFNAYDAHGDFDPWGTWTRMHAWFAARGLCIMQLHAGLMPDCYYLAEGPQYPVPAGADHLGHMVVMRAGNLAHDPMGPGAPGLWRVDHVYVVIPMSLGDVRPHGWHPAWAGGYQLDGLERTPVPTGPDPWDTIYARARGHGAGGALRLDTPVYDAINDGSTWFAGMDFETMTDAELDAAMAADDNLPF